MSTVFFRGMDRLLRGAKGQLGGKAVDPLHHLVMVVEEDCQAVLGSDTRYSRRGLSVGIPLSIKACLKESCRFAMAGF